MADQYYVDSGYVDDGYYVYIADAVSAQSSEFSQTASVNVTASASADFGALFTPSITANASVNGIPDFSSEFTISVDPVKNTATSITLDNIVNISLSAAPIRSTSISLNGTFTQSAQLQRIRFTDSNLNTEFAQSAQAHITAQASSTQTSQFTQTAEVGRVSTYWINFYSNSYYITDSVQLSDDSIIAVAENSAGRSQLLKLTSSGNIIWHKQYELSTADLFNQIVRLSDDSVIVAGGRYIQRITSSGTVSWSKLFSSIGNYTYLSNRADASNNVYLSGGSNSAVIKIDSSGSIVWQKRLSSGQVVSTRPVLDSSGNIYVGSYQSTNANVFKLSSSTGDRIGLISVTERVRDILLDNQDNIYLTGYANGGVYQFVSKWSNSLVNQWFYNEGQGFANARFIGIDPIDNGVYISNGSEYFLKLHHNFPTRNVEYFRQLTQTTWSIFDTGSLLINNLDRNRLAILFNCHRRVDASESSRSGGLGLIPLNGSGTPDSPFSYTAITGYDFIDLGTHGSSNSTSVSLTSDTVTISDTSPLTVSDLTSTLTNYTISQAGNYENVSAALTTSVSISAQATTNTGITANLTSSASIALLGGFLKGIESNLNSTVSLTAAVTRVQESSSSLNTNFSQTATVYRTQEFNTNLTTSCSLALSGSITARFAIPLNSSVILAEDNVRIRDFSVSLAAFVAQLTAAAKVGVTLVDLDSVFTQSAQAQITARAITSLDSEFNQSLSPLATRLFDAALSVTSSLTVDADLLSDIEVNLTTDINLSAAAQRLRSSDVSLTATGNLSLTGTRIQSANVSVSSSTTLSLAASSLVAASTNLNSAFAQTAQSARTRQTDIALSATTSLAIEYIRYRNFEISQLSLFTPSITAVLSADRGSDMTASSSLSAAAVKTARTLGNFNSQFDLIADIRGIRQAEANLNSTANLTALSRVIRTAVCNLTLTSTVSVSTVKTVQTSSNLTAMAAILSTGRDLQLDLYPTYRIRPESRLHRIRQETRLHRIRAETRIATVRSDQ